jgi:hypothetical protein
MIIVNRIRLRLKACVVSSGFVVHLERKNVYGFLDKGGASYERSSIQESL